MNKQTVVYSYNELVLSNKKEWTTSTCNNMGEFKKYYAEWKKPDIYLKSYYMIQFIWSLWTGKSNLCDRTQNSGCQRGWKIGKGYWKFWGDGNVLYRHTSFYCIPLSCTSQILHFLQIEGRTLHQQKDYNSLKAQVMVSIF